MCSINVGVSCFWKDAMSHSASFNPFPWPVQIAWEVTNIRFDAWRTIVDAQKCLSFEQIIMGSGED